MNEKRDLLVACIDFDDPGRWGCCKPVGRPGNLRVEGLGDKAGHNDFGLCLCILFTLVVVARIDADDVL